MNGTMTAGIGSAAYGNEKLEFDRLWPDAPAYREHPMIFRIKESDRKYHWPLGRRPTAIRH